MLNAPLSYRKTTEQSIRGLLQLINGSWSDKRSVECPLTLPPMQRNSIWRPRQVLELWRSVFAGLPIGLFYVERYSGGRKVVKPYRSEGQDAAHVIWKIEEVKGPGLDLIDGQQRMRALSLGLGDPLGEQRSIWVKFVDGRYELLLTSRAQPFGYNDVGGKLRLSERRRAREVLEPGDTELRFRDAVDRKVFQVFDSDLYGHPVMGNGELPCPPFPYGCTDKDTVRLDTILTAWSDSGQNAVAAILPANVSKNKFLCDLKNLDEVVAVLMEVGTQVLDGDRGFEFFRRIGAGGTPLSEAEQIYSAFKIKWPHIRTVVEDIHRDVSAAFTPAQIVTALLRIANVQATKRVWAPGLDLAIKAIRGGGTDQRLSETLLALVPDTRAPLPVAEAFRSAKTLLSSGEDAFNLSDIVLASLPPELWQALVYWCLLDPVQSEETKREAVRLAMFWKFAVTNQDGAAQTCFAVISDLAHNNGQTFPGKLLYQQLTDKGQAIELSCPIALRPFFERSRSSEETGIPQPIWLTHKQRFGEEKGPAQTAVYWWYAAHMLTWLQRNYLKSTFPGFFPLSDHEEDLPYDADHICPRDHWRHWSYKGLPERPRDFRQEILAARDHLGNSIGNYRLVGAPQNRGDGNARISVKMPALFGDDDGKNEGKLSDFLMADAANIENWRSSDGEAREWPNERFEAFEKAVEMRTAALYGEFYHKLDYRSWLEDSTAEVIPVAQ